MSTLILLFSIITQGSTPVAATPGTNQAPEPMRYHGVDVLLAKFDAEASSQDAGQVLASR